MILADGILGQMMEPLYLTEYEAPSLPAKDWILDGCKDREPRVVKSLFMGEGELERRNIHLQKKYSLMKEKEVMYDAIETDDAEIVVVAFGIAARVALSAVQNLRKEGLAVGLFRPITLFPFPEKPLTDLADMVERLLVVELNAGQMVEDVKLAVNGKVEVDFYGRMGGGTLTPDEVYDELKKVHSNMPVKN